MTNLTFPVFMVIKIYGHRARYKFIIKISFGLLLSKLMFPIFLRIPDRMFLDTNGPQMSTSQTKTQTDATINDYKGFLFIPILLP